MKPGMWVLPTQLGFGEGTLWMTSLDLPSATQPLFLSAVPTALHRGLPHLTGSKGHLQTLPTGRTFLKPAILLHCDWSGPPSPWWTEPEALEPVWPQKSHEETMRTSSWVLIGELGNKSCLLPGNIRLHSQGKPAFTLEPHRLGF